MSDYSIVVRINETTMSLYISDLRKKFKSINNQLSELEVNVFDLNRTKDTQWWKEYQKVVDLRNDKATVESRINNVGKNNYMPEYQIPNIKL